MALRDADVQPPKTAATQSLVSSLPIFSAKTAGSDAPSSSIGLIFLPRMPPLALISSAARLSESRTVCSEIAMAPAVEFRNPSLMLSPEVSTQLFAPEAESPSEDFEPHPLMTSAAVMTAAVLAMSLVRDFTTGMPFGS